MHIAGIIAEYDPFHKGHAAHIAATRAEAGGNATHIVTVLSGSFTQRGEPAMLSKFCRAEMALSAGSDLVLELPLPWSMAPAERFAAGGIALLHALGCVEILSFGSECGNAESLQRLAQIPDDPAYRKTLHQALDTGIPYAAARQVAACALAGETDGALLASPNNTLGVEYIRAVKAQGADFQLFTLSRQGALHSDDVPVNGFASGSFLRKAISAGALTEAAAYMPRETFALLKTALEHGEAPADAHTIDIGILARLRRMTREKFAILPYLSEGLENRLYEASRSASSIQELLALVKTRRYPLSRIRRILWSAMLGMTAEDATGLPPYIRVLGMNQRGREILAAARPSLPLVSRAVQFAGLDARAQRVHRLECSATDLRALLLPTPQPCGTDQTAKMLVKNE